MLYLKQSTSVTIKFGAFVDATDGFTPETSLSIGQADIRLSKNGGNSDQTNNATGATHDEFGQYDIPLDDTDTDTLGILKVMVYESGSRPVSAEFMVIEEESYNLITGVTNVPDLVWDELLTASIHNDPTSAGRRLRQASSPFIVEGTVVSATRNTVVLDSAGSSNDGAYDPALICILSGKGIGQARGIYEYKGSTKTAYVDRDWKDEPDGTSGYMIHGWAGREHVNEGKAQGGTSSTIILNSLASSVDGTYVGQQVFIRSGAGQDQVKTVTGYTGSSKVAVIEGTWYSNPDDTSVYCMQAHIVNTPSDIADATVAKVISEPSDISDKSLGAMLWHLFARFYHKVTQTATDQIAYKSDGATPLGSMTTSDDGTTQTKGKAT